MIKDRFALRKFYEAGRILQACFGEKGVWADPSRYEDTCWTRDFGLAIQPLLLQLGEFEICRNHLSHLAALQRPNGQIPILFLDNEERWVKMKEEEEKQNGKVPFMLRRYREGELWNLTPGTRDSEVNYLVAMLEYAKARSEVVDSEFPHWRDSCRQALEYIERNLMEGGLVIGCDWRDTMEKELGDKPLLTNNCLLFHAYDLLGEQEKLVALRYRISHYLCDKDRLLDYPGATRFDPLGGSLAVLYEIVNTSYFHSGVLHCLTKEVDSDYGVTIKCRHNPHTPEEAPVIERTDGVVVWPFVVGFAVLALRSMGADRAADKQLRKLQMLDGFREWYDPADGKGYGAEQQLWSAALYMRAMMNR